MEQKGTRVLLDEFKWLHTKKSWSLDIKIPSSAVLPQILRPSTELARTGIRPNAFSLQLVLLLSEWER